MNERDESEALEIAWTEYEKENWAVAVVLWREMISRFPANPSGYIGLALTHKKLQHFEVAEAVLSQAIIAFPASEPVRVEYAWSANHCGDHNEARRRWATVRSLFRDSPHGYLGGGFTEKSIGNAKAAEDILSSGRKILPKNEAIALNYGWTANLQKNWAIAKQRWDSLLKEFPENVEMTQGRTQAVERLSLVESSQILKGSSMKVNTDFEEVKEYPIKTIELIESSKSHLFNVVLVTMIKDEVSYLDEWINYYINLGVSYFVIYDNNSTDDLYAWSRKYINLGFIQLVYWPKNNSQLAAFTHAYEIHRHLAKYLCFFDVDEFLVLKNHDSISEFMEFVQGDQVLIPWLNFGYCNHKTKPEGLVIENYKHTSFGPTLVKQIIKPEKVEFVGVHCSHPTSGSSIKYEDGSVAPHTSICAKPRYLNAQINHYHTKSFEEYLTRVAKGEAALYVNKNIIPFALIDYEKNSSYFEDFAIKKNIQKTKDLINFHNNLTEDVHIFLNPNYSKFQCNNELIYKFLIIIGNYLTNDIIVRDTNYKFVSINQNDDFNLQSSLNSDFCELYLRNNIIFEAFVKSNNFSSFINFYKLVPQSKYSTGTLLLIKEEIYESFYLIKIFYNRTITSAEQSVNFTENSLKIYFS